MNYTKLGNTDIEVSRLCVGGMSFGQPSEDFHLIGRVDELARKYGVTMTEIALAWHYAKGVAAPIVGATSMANFDDAVRAADLTLTEEDVTILEEVYAPHSVVGALPEA